MSLSDDVKSLALDVGFHAVGITTVEPFVEAERTLAERLECGLLEGSGFDAESIRAYTHPQATFPGAKSIVSVALSYLSEESDRSAQEPSPQSGIPNPKSPRGWVARFSLGLDYHPVMQERLLLLAEAVRSRVGGRADIRQFVDTGPLLDRSVAIRAGVGSRGKNTCVYVRRYSDRLPVTSHQSPVTSDQSPATSNARGLSLVTGHRSLVTGYSSWVILGGLLTDLDLEPDEPAPLDVCGECDRCVKACPTGAICAPYVVDVRICLSQVTQMKGFIPEQLREKLGTRIYGCDTCQSACPLNKDAKPGNVDAFRPSAGLGASPELLPLLNITSAEFRERVGPTTASWIRRTRFRRNVAVALGNIRDPIAVPGLSEALSDPEPLMRGHSAWALGRIGTPSARQALEAALAHETDDQVVGEIRSALDRGGAT